MSGIKEAAVCICVCCVLCGTLKMLVPSTQFDKLIRLSIGVFLLCSVIAPIQNAVKEIGSPQITLAAVERNERMEEAVIDFSSSMLENIVSGQIESALLSEGVEAENIKIYMDILNDGSISISQAEVTLSSEDYAKRDSLSRTVYTRTGVNAKFITEEE